MQCIKLLVQFIGSVLALWFELTAFVYSSILTNPAVTVIAFVHFKIIISAVVRKKFGPF